MMVPRGETVAAGFDRKMRLGKCECGAHVCVNCHQLARDGHKCPTVLKRDVPTDKATLKLMKNLGKNCPNCGAYV